MVMSLAVIKTAEFEMLLVLIDPPTIEKLPDLLVSKSASIVIDPVSVAREPAPEMATPLAAVSVILPAPTVKTGS